MRCVPPRPRNVFVRHQAQVACCGPPPGLKKKATRGATIGVRGLSAPLKSTENKELGHQCRARPHVHTACRRRTRCSTRTHRQSASVPARCCTEPAGAVDRRGRERPGCGLLAAAARRIVGSAAGTLRVRLGWLAHVFGRGCRRNRQPPALAPPALHLGHLLQKGSSTRVEQVRATAERAPR